MFDKRSAFALEKKTRLTVFQSTSVISDFQIFAQKLAAKRRNGRRFFSDRACPPRRLPPFLSKRSPSLSHAPRHSRFFSTGFSGKIDHSRAVAAIGVGPSRNGRFFPGPIPLGIDTKAVVRSQKGCPPCREHGLLSAADRRRRKVYRADVLFEVSLNKLDGAGFGEIQKEEVKVWQTAS